MKNNYRHHDENTYFVRVKKSALFSLFVTLCLIVGLFLLISNAQQQQIQKMLAQTPLQQACTLDTPITEPTELQRLFTYCSKHPDDATQCTNYCPRTNKNDPTLNSLCQPGGTGTNAGVYVCGGTCEQATTCSTAPYKSTTGLDVICASGGICCQAPSAVNGPCTTPGSTTGCQAGLTCNANKTCQPGTATGNTTTGNTTAGSGAQPGTALGVPPGAPAFPGGQPAVQPTVGGPPAGTPPGTGGYGTACTQKSDCIQDPNTPLDCITNYCLYPQQAPAQQAANPVPPPVGAPLPPPPPPPAGTVRVKCPDGSYAFVCSTALAGSPTIGPPPDQSPPAQTNIPLKGTGCAVVGSSCVAGASCTESVDNPSGTCDASTPSNVAN